MKRLALCLILALPAAGPAAAELPSLSYAKAAPIAWSLDKKNYSTVHFDFDRDFLDARAKAKLHRQAAFIKKHHGITFAVTGHTDKVGNTTYNEGLGMRRAQRVVAYLVSLGVDRQQLRAMVSFGEDKPVVNSEDRERLNRRVTTTVLMPRDARLPEPAKGGSTSQAAYSPPVKSSDPAPQPAPAPAPTTTSTTTDPAPDSGSKSRSMVNSGRGNGDEPGGDPRGAVKNKGGDEKPNT